MSRAIQDHKVEPAYVTYHPPQPLVLTVKCPTCSGKGTQAARRPDRQATVYEEIPCLTCHGSGRALTSKGKEVAEVVRLVLAGRA